MKRFLVKKPVSLRGGALFSDDEAIFRHVKDCFAPPLAGLAMTLGDNLERLKDYLWDGRWNKKNL